MKNILIPTDFSENSHNVIKYALEFFVGVPVHFYILNVSLENTNYKKGEKSFYESSLNENTVETSSLLLREEIKRCNSWTKNPFHSFYSLQENMPIVDAVKKLVAEKEIDFILMGTRGALKIGRMEIGSNTRDIITKVKCPVFVIPENATFNKLKNLAFLTDYNFIYRDNVISKLSEILQLHTATIRMLHIKSHHTETSISQRDNKGFLYYSFKEKNSTFHALENQNMEVGLLDYVKTWEIDMIVLVAKNLNFMERFVFKPTVTLKTSQTEIPFFVLHQ